MISSDPEPQITWSKLHLNFFEISFRRLFDFESGYLDNLLIFDIFFLTLGEKPSADSLADNLITFFLFKSIDLPGL